MLVVRTTSSVAYVTCHSVMFSLTVPPPGGTEGICPERWGLPLVHFLVPLIVGRWVGGFLVQPIETFILVRWQMSPLVFHRGIVLLCNIRVVVYSIALLRLLYAHSIDARFPPKLGQAGRICPGCLHL